MLLLVAADVGGFVLKKCLLLLRYGWAFCARYLPVA